MDVQSVVHSTFLCTKLNFITTRDMFRTWWTATCRQRINSNGFNAIWFILLKRTNINSIHSVMYKIYINYIILVLRKMAHIVRADPSSSCLTCPLLLVLLHVVSALVEHQLLIFLASWGAGPRQRPAPMSGTRNMPHRGTTYVHNTITLTYHPTGQRWLCVWFWPILRIWRTLWLKWMTNLNLGQFY